MIETLKAKGWQKNGGCSSCGIQNWVNAAFPETVIKTKAGMFKIVKNGSDVGTYNPQHELQTKLTENGMG